MKVYDGNLEVGMNIIYNGSPIEWCNPRTGKVNEVMNQGEYIISNITNKFICLKSNRKNATTEHKIYKDDIEGRIKVIEFSDMTCTMGLIAMNLNNPTWVLADDNFKKSLANARKYNRR